MGFELTTPPAVVRLDDFRAVERDTLERIHCDENNAGVRVDAMLSITIVDCMEYLRKLGSMSDGMHAQSSLTRWLVKMRQRSQIISGLE